MTDLPTHEHCHMPYFVVFKCFQFGLVSFGKELNTYRPHDTRTLSYTKLSRHSYPFPIRQPHVAQSVAQRIRAQQDAGSIPDYFPTNADSHCDRIHSSLTADHGFAVVHVRKQQMWSFGRKELEENMNVCTGIRDITDVMLKTALSKNQSIFPYFPTPFVLFFFMYPLLPSPLSFSFHLLI